MQQTCQLTVIREERQLNAANSYLFARRSHNTLRNFKTGLCET